MDADLCPWRVRVQLATDFLVLLNFLHHGPLGTRVMCDANSVEKLFTQFLVSDELRLLLNDVDALPQANYTAGQTVRCGHREIHAHSFIAPEQLWPYPNQPFEDARMPGYDEKVDIWKVPPALQFLLLGVPAPNWCYFHVQKWVCSHVLAYMRST